MSRQELPPKRVAILQSVIPQYRLEFFKKLIALGRTEGIHIDIYTGDPPKKSQSRGDISEEYLSKKLRTWSFNLFGRTLRIRSTGPVIKGNYDLVILEQTLQTLDTFVLIFRLGNKRCAFWGHGGTYSKNIPDWQQKLKYWLTRKGTWFFGYTSGGVKAVVNQGYSRERCTVLRSSIDTYELRGQLAKVNNDILLDFKMRHDLRGHTALYIGGLDSYKRIPLLLELATEAHRLNPEFRLLIVGDGQDRWLVEHASAQNSWIIYLGRLVDEKKAIALEAAQILAIPGAIGLVALDALVSGTPIVTTPSAMHGPEFEYLDPLRTVKLVSESEYPKELISLLANPNLMQEMSDYCIADSKYFSLEHMVAEFVGGIQGAFVK